MVARACRQLAISHRAQLAAQRLLADPDAELLPDPVRQVDEPPAHDAVGRRNRATLDDLGQGPPLTDNLRRAVAGLPAKPFVPQGAFLSLISTGDKAAIASRSWWSASGAWVWRVKDHIDRTWMDKAKAVPDMTQGPSGTALPSASADDPLGVLKSEPMRCGGCGAKVGATYPHAYVGSPKGEANRVPGLADIGAEFGREFPVAGELL